MFHARGVAIVGMEASSEFLFPALCLKWNLTNLASASIVCLICGGQIQFEPVKFVDGLLGVGAAGGSVSKAEGDKLQARLDTLRKERAERAPEIKKKVPAAMGAGPNPNQSAGGGGGGNSRPRRGNPNKRKKKKKGRR